MEYNYNMMSFDKLDKAYCRANPNKFIIYKQALVLLKLYNGNERNFEWSYVRQPIDFPVYATECVLTLGTKLALEVLASNER